MINIEFSSHSNKKEDILILYSDNWDDFGYKTLFHVSYFDKDGNKHDIGSIKIYTRELERNYPKKTEDYISVKKIEQLNENFCSLGQSTSYYTNLKYFLPDNYIEILNRLNDIATNNDLRKKFINEDGVKNSLLRESSAYKALEEANFYLINKTNLNDLSFTLNYKAPYSDKETNINFNFKKNDIFPYRINVLVGKNGTGKTYLLTRLANLLSGLTDDYEDYNTFFFRK